MLRTTIVVRLVLLVLALNVVAFVTRIAEKMQARQSLVKMLRNNHFYRTGRRTGDLDAPTNPDHTSLGFASLPWRQLDIHDPKN